MRNKALTNLVSIFVWVVPPFRLTQSIGYGEGPIGNVMPGYHSGNSPFAYMYNSMTYVMQLD